MIDAELQKRNELGRIANEMGSLDFAQGSKTSTSAELAKLLAEDASSYKLLIALYAGLRQQHQQLFGNAVVAYELESANIRSLATAALSGLLTIHDQDERDAYFAELPVLFEKQVLPLTKQIPDKFLNGGDYYDPILTIGLAYAKQGHDLAQQCTFAFASHEDKVFSPLYEMMAVSLRNALEKDITPGERLWYAEAYNWIIMRDLEVSEYTADKRTILELTIEGMYAKDRTTRRQNLAHAMPFLTQYQNGPPVMSALQNQLEHNPGDVVSVYRGFSNLFEAYPCHKVTIQDVLPLVEDQHVCALDLVSSLPDSYGGQVAEAVSLFTQIKERDEEQYCELLRSTKTNLVKLDVLQLYTE